MRCMRSLDAARLEHDVRPFAGLVPELILREPLPPRKREAAVEPVLREEATDYGPQSAGRH